jgi:hypothetical protein
MIRTVTTDSTNSLFKGAFSAVPLILAQNFTTRSIMVISFSNTQRSREHKPDAPDDQDNASTPKKD